MEKDGLPPRPAAAQLTVTGQHVAALAGVSKSAVSVVLNGNGTRHGLSQTTQERVQAAALALGYMPNLAASSLRRRRCKTITLVTTDLGNRFFADVAAAAETEARARGYVLNIVSAPTSEAEADLLQRQCNGTTDGLLIHGATDRPQGVLAGLAARGIACVLLQDPGAGEAIPCVRADIEQGGFLATSHLLSLGHTAIAHITDRRTARHARNERLEGYRRALGETSSDPRLVVHGDNSMAGGADAMSELLALPNPPTAVFAYNDQMAFGAMHILARRGLRVPEDVAVVGFDGTDLGAFSIPALTTIEHPRQELGRLAAAAVLDQLAGRTPPPTQILPIRLVVRRSCGAHA